jgi:hypothetical protein
MPLAGAGGPRSQSGVTPHLQVIAFDKAKGYKDAQQAASSSISRFRPLAHGTRRKESFSCVMAALRHALSPPRCDGLYFSRRLTTKLQ